MRPTQSELGEVDPAAAFEFMRGRGYIYKTNNKSTCLVEMDEEPPHSLNKEAIKICLIVALMVRAKPVDEIHVMRKIVIDGSNTTGFQRSCIIALSGEIEVKGKKIRLQTLNLEEDAARKIKEEEPNTLYWLDRLGIPLIEIATAPVITNPKAAEEVAFALGRILRATKMVRRGLGTIRQDLNVSIRNGAITEIKGVQTLALVSKVVKLEVQRQMSLLRIRDELENRGIKIEDLDKDFVDITIVFKNTKCKTIRNAIQRGERVISVVLSLFGRLLKYELVPGLKFGKEFSDYAKFWGKVGGIFHTDELPAYGISFEEIEKIKKVLSEGEDDAIVFVIGQKQNCIDALHAIVERAKQALKGIPNETRRATPNGITYYSRPRPGAARMYPETDVPPVPITPTLLASIKKKLPELPDKKILRLKKEYGINEKLALQLFDSEYDDLFERIIDETAIAPSFVAATLTESLKSIKREGIDIECLSEDLLLELFKIVDKGLMTKEGVIQVIKWMGMRKNLKIWDAIKALDLRIISGDELEKIIKKIVQDNRDLIKQRGLSALSGLMGIIMKKYRGKVDPRIVNLILKKKIKNNYGL